MAEDGSIYRQGVARGDGQNSVGAGDSMVAGFIAGYLETGDCRYALKLGTACGGATHFQMESEQSRISWNSWKHFNETGGASCMRITELLKEKVLNWMLRLIPRKRPLISWYPLWMQADA